MNTNRKISFCKWALLALIIACTLVIFLPHLTNTFEPWLLSPFIVQWSLSLFLGSPHGFLFGLACSCGLAGVGWGLLSCGIKAGRTLLLIAFLPGAIVSAIAFPVALLGLFFEDTFYAIMGIPSTICIFIMLSASVGGLSLTHIWSGSKT